MNKSFTTRKGFTLFEVMLALAVFVLATLGLVQAIGGTIDGALIARDRVLVRTLLESRLAFCLALPPAPGKQRRLSPETTGGFQVLETLTPESLTNALGMDIPAMYRLTIQVGQPATPSNETVSLLIHHPGPFMEDQKP